MSESGLQTDCLNSIAGRKDVWVLNVVGSARQKTGTPDLLLSVCGIFTAIELKLPDGNYDLTGAQRVNLRLIRQTGAVAVKATSVDAFLSVVNAVANSINGSIRSYTVEERGCGTPCWLWLRGTDNDGYGKLNGKKAHRVYYETAHGAIPDGMQIDHLCSVRSCVNPEHLEVVSTVENTRRGRVPILSVESVRQIKDLIESGETDRVIAERFLVSPSTIYDIRTKRTWRF